MTAWVNTSNSSAQAFENLKSRYGADGELNTGSSGSYRQLVGDFIEDGGLADPNPGFASRDYSEGQVVFKANGLASQSGYFMALTHVKAVAIEDTALPTSQWIRIADAEGVGSAEAYPDSPEYNFNSIKYNSSGDQVAYLKVTESVPAHWASPGSYLFLEAQADVPRGLTLSDIFALDGNGVQLTLVTASISSMLEKILAIMQSQQLSTFVQTSTLRSHPSIPGIMRHSSLIPSKAIRITTSPPLM